MLRTPFIDAETAMWTLDITSSRESVRGIGQGLERFVGETREYILLRRRYCPTLVGSEGKSHGLEKTETDRCSTNKKAQGEGRGMKSDTACCEV